MYSKKNMLMALRGISVREIDKNIDREQKDRIMKECWKCKHKKEVAGNAHIACSEPDYNMTGNQHGIESGWFMYPLLFDPVWKTKLCSNFSSKEVNRVVSDSVSGEKAR